MLHSDRLAAFIALGNHLRQLPADTLTELTAHARNRNAWFDLPNVTTAVKSVADMLTDNTLTRWAARYPAEPSTSKQVGVVMAGNIPLVGFHDALCVLLSGHTLLAKFSKDDSVLMTWVLNELTKLEPRFQERIQIQERLNAADAFIATGSDNTARYFDYYFGKRPHIIRRNRTSLGVLTGHETDHELSLLGEDIFRYYGLGCRNVSKLFVPQNYNFSPLLDSLRPWQHVVDHHKYNNNYDYNKSILLVNGVAHLDTGYLLLLESPLLVSPISVLHYGTYAHEVDLVDQLTDVAAQTQCIVSGSGQWAGSTAFGQAQYPSVSDYADGVDTMAFLAELA